MGAALLAWPVHLDLMAKTLEIGIQRLTHALGEQSSLFETQLECLNLLHGDTDYSKRHAISIYIDWQLSLSHSKRCRL